MLGELQVARARHEDTLVDIARRFNVGYDELRNANPGVDPWLPGEGTTIVLPTLYVMPDGPREGILINVAAMPTLLPEGRDGGTPNRRHLPDRHRQDRPGHASGHDESGLEAQGPGVDTARIGAPRSTPPPANRCPRACGPAPTIRWAPTR